MKYLKAAYFWIVLVSLTIILYLWIALNQLWIVLTGKPKDGRIHHKTATFWGQSIIRLTPGWEVQVEGLEHLPKDRDPVVIVANHESMADIWALFYLGSQFRWFAKAEIRKIPIIGQVMRWTGYIFIKRGNKQSAAKSMESSRKVIAEGLCMLFFPEGTRSEDHIIKPFKAGAFKLAAETGVDILPVAIHGAGVMFPKGSGIPRQSTVKLKILPRIATPKSEENLADYASMVREKIVEAHKELL